LFPESAIQYAPVDEDNMIVAWLLSLAPSRGSDFAPVVSSEQGVLP
jgi:hypothetical protein